MVGIDWANGGRTIVFESAVRQVVAVWWRKQAAFPFWIIIVIIVAIVAVLLIFLFLRARRKEEEEVRDEVVNLAGACPICGGPLKYESGCVSCALNCGYSECG